MSRDRTSSPQSSRSNRSDLYADIKPDMVREAERLMADAEWLPEPLRTPVPVMELPANDAETAALPAFLDEPSGGAPGPEEEAEPLQAIAAE